MMVQVVVQGSGLGVCVGANRRTWCVLSSSLLLLSKHKEKI